MTPKRNGLCGISVTLAQPPSERVCAGRSRSRNRQASCTGLTPGRRIEQSWASAASLCAHAVEGGEMREVMEEGRGGGLPGDRAQPTGGQRRRLRTPTGRPHSGLKRGMDPGAATSGDCLRHSPPVERATRDGPRPILKGAGRSRGERGAPTTVCSPSAPSTVSLHKTALGRAEPKVGLCTRGS
jgi:hypothetical protein